MAVIEAVTIVLALRERRAKRKAENELRQIRRRGDAPFLQPSDKMVSNLWVNTATGGISCIPSINALVLHKSRKQVQLEDGQLVYFVVENTGESARAVSIKLDDEIISLQREPDVQGAHGLQYLVYPYRKAKHGKDQRLSLSFETRSGVQDIHYYCLRHGFWALRRIDPTLPE
jgi:hypothetical protein